MKYIALSAALLPVAAFAQEATTPPIDTALTDSLADTVVAGVLTHPAAAAIVVGIWVVQTVIKFILATTTTKEVWWYKALEVAAGLIGKAKQIAPKK